MQTTMVQVSWNKIQLEYAVHGAANKLSDGILTYTNVNGGQTEQAAIRDAIQEWELPIPNLKFSEVVTPTIEAPVETYNLSFLK